MMRDVNWHDHSQACSELNRLDEQFGTGSDSPLHHDNRCSVHTSSGVKPWMMECPKELLILSTYLAQRGHETTGEQVGGPTWVLTQPAPDGTIIVITEESLAIYDPFDWFAGDGGLPTVERNLPENLFEDDQTYNRHRYIAARLDELVAECTQ
jgi:hypothetical protein